MAVTIPANDRKAASLQLLSLVLSFCSLLLYPPKLKPSPYLTPNMFYVSQVLGFLLCVGLIWAVRIGKRWAKITWLVLFVLSTPFYLLQLPHLFTLPPVQVALSLLSTIVHGVSIVIIARDLLRRPKATF